VKVDDKSLRRTRSSPLDISSKRIDDELTDESAIDFRFFFDLLVANYNDGIRQNKSPPLLFSYSALFHAIQNKFITLPSLSPFSSHPPLSRFYHQAPVVSNANKRQSLKNTKCMKITSTA
jgi:hypothetical protein